MAYGLSDEYLYLHGANVNALLQAAQDQELCATVTLLEEASAKVDRGDPVDEAEDLVGSHWGGSVPIVSLFGT